MYWMGTIIQDLSSELADNWPAFTYILMTLVFSVCFFRERRAEKRLVQEISEGIQDDIRSRFDRLERLVRASGSLHAAGTRTNSEANDRGSGLSS